MLQLAVLVWVSIAGLGFAAGLVGIAVTKRRLFGDQAPAVKAVDAAVHDSSFSGT